MNTTTRGFTIAAAAAGKGGMMKRHAMRMFAGAAALALLAPGTARAEITGGYWKLPALPADVQVVEWIHSDGNQWFDSGVAVDDYTLDADVQFSATYSSAYSMIFSAYNGESAGGYRVLFSNSSTAGLLITCYGKSGGGNMTIPSYRNGMVAHIRNMTQYGFSYSLDGGAESYVANTYPVSSLPGNNLMFFGQGLTAVTACKIIGSLYLAQVRKGGAVVRNFVPVVSNSVAYAYDLENGAFYRNQGTGAFTYGPVVTNLTEQLTAEQVYAFCGAQDLPTITNAGGVTNVTAGSAWLNGALVATGTSATAVSVYWGTTDGGTNAADWGADAHWSAPQEPGDFTVQAPGLEADSVYFYRFAASNEAGMAWTEAASAFITGEVWIEKTADAAETGPTPGTFTVHRVSSAVGCDLAVAYALAGTATEGEDYASPGGTLIIPAGETSAPLVVAPVFDRALEEDETVAVTLLAGPFLAGTSTSDTLTIEDHRLQVTWDGSGDMNWTQPDATSWSGTTYETNGFAAFAGAGQGTVTLSGTITPGGVTVGAGAYTFDGTAIGGIGGLTVSGGTLVINNAANAYAGDTAVGKGATLQINQDNRLPYGAGKGDATVDGCLVLNDKNVTLNGLNGAGSGVIYKIGANSRTLTLGAGDASGVFGGVIRRTAGTLDVTKTGGGTQTLGGTNSYNGATVVNGGILALGGSNTLAGTVTVNAGATLRLGHPQALGGAPLVVAAGGATLDTTGLAAPLPLASGQTLRIDGDGATATLATAPGNGLATAATGALHINAYDGATPALTVAGGGGLTVSSNSAVTVTVAGETPLAIGDYLLVTDGAAGVAPAAVTVNGAGRAAATTAELLFDGDDLVLRITPYAPAHEPGEIATQAAGDWYQSATWTNGIIPGPGDRVTVNHDVTLRCGTHALESATIAAGKTLTFETWSAFLDASNVTVHGTLTHAPQNAVAPDPVSGEWIPDNRVWIVCSNLTVESGGAINVNNKGYAGGNSVHANGYGPRGGPGGAPHGGFGGMGYGADINSIYPCGDALAPEWPGSGGGKNGGGYGGGAIRIDATSGVVTVIGTITANGQNYVISQASSGAGGSISITCKTIAGTGVIRANGGSTAPWGANGSGGRIAVRYDPPAQGGMPPPAIQYSVLPGGLPPPADRSSGYNQLQADIGTVHFPDAALLCDPINVSGQILLDGLSWAPNRLTISNQWIRFPQEGFRLTVSNDVTILKGATVGRLDIGASVLTNFGVGTTGGAWNGYRFFGASTAPELQVGGSLVLTNGALLHVYSAPTNGVAPEYGALVNVGGTMRIEENSWVYPYAHWSNGAAPLFRVQSLTVATNAGFIADYAGYGISSSGVNYGPGRAAYTKGGSYGGLGGGVTDAGKIYGSSNAPALPGSPGYTGGGGYGGFGGGLIRLDAGGAVTLNGIMTANGGWRSQGWSSSGSGGGVYLRCRSFCGNPGAVIRANGATGSPAGGGGGGRIAVWRVTDHSPGGDGREVVSNSVAGGLYQTPPAQEGTVVWGWIPASGTVLLLR